MEEFVDAVGRLYDTLSIPDRDKILLRNDRRRKTTQETSFVVSKQSPLNCFSPRLMRTQGSWHQRRTSTTLMLQRGYMRSERSIEQSVRGTCRVSRTLPLSLSLCQERLDPIARTGKPPCKAITLRSDRSTCLTNNPHLSQLIKHATDKPSHQHSPTRRHLVKSTTWRTPLT